MINKNSIKFSIFWNIHFFCDVNIFRLGKKAPKVLYCVSRVMEKSKSIIDGTLKLGVFF